MVRTCCHVMQLAMCFGATIEVGFELFFILLLPPVLSNLCPVRLFSDINIIFHVRREYTGYKLVSRYLWLNIYSSFALP